jgi:nitroreductase family protein
MSEEVSVLFEIMQTTRSMRRLKPDPVPPALIRKILEAGTSAPSGGNMQRWRFLVIRDPEIKKTVGAYYKRAWDEVVSPRYRAGEPAPGTNPDRFSRMLDAAQYLADHIHEAPVWIVPCMQGANPSRTAGSSIYPAVQNMLLAARALGPRSHADHTVSQFREGGRSGPRFTVRCAFVCTYPDRLSNGPLRTGSPCATRRCSFMETNGASLIRSSLSLRAQ